MQLDKPKQSWTISNELLQPIDQFVLPKGKPFVNVVEMQEAEEVEDID